MPNAAALESRPTDRFRPLVDCRAGFQPAACSNCSQHRVGTHRYTDYQDILNEVFAHHGVTLAYLYGSQARGDAGPLSDVDVGVLFDASLSEEVRFQRRLALAGELYYALGRDDVSVVDLVEAPPLLRHRVYYDGQVLYCPDDAERVRFEMKRSVTT